MQIPHVPVLYDEILNTFKNINNSYIIDCTIGFGGHSFGLLSRNKTINMICNDQDKEALEFSKLRLEQFKSRIIFNQGNFKNLLEDYKQYDIKGILADIGVSSLQLDKTQRGFGFTSEVLDMRMNQNQTLDANIVVNTYSQNDLERIFKDYAQVREYKKVASLIVNNRPFASSKQLADFLLKNMYKKKLHPATLPFQAIRIEVNDELGVLNSLFRSIETLKPRNCLIAIISFHSLEDKIVKKYFKKWTQSCNCPRIVYKCECGNNNALGKILTKKPIIPTTKEIKQNIRSRSSKLRIFKFD